MKRRFFFVFLALLIASCAATLPYSTDYPLTPDYFHSRDGILTGKIPQGWFSSTDDTLAPALNLWLVKEDFSASLTIKEIKLDPLAKQQVVKEGLGLLAHISAGFQEEIQANNEIETQEFKLNEKDFCGYEIGIGANRKRVVVFFAGGKCYECEAHPLKGIWQGTDLARLFTIQQTVLFSLIF